MITSKNTIVKISCLTNGSGIINITALANINKVIVQILDSQNSVFELEKSFCVEEKDATIPFNINNPKLWSVLDPFLYDVVLKIFYNDTSETITESFGIRELGKNNHNILLNGKEFYVRGYIRGIKCHDHKNNCNLSEEDFYKKNILQAKKFGFNFIRFHSTIPNETFFKVADKLGILVQIEFREDIDEYNNLEEMVSDTLNVVNVDFVNEVINKVCNHPSLAVYCIGNEMKGDKVAERVQKLSDFIKAKDNSRLFIDSCAWGVNGRKWVDIDIQHMSYYFPFSSHADMYENTENLLVCGDVDGNTLQNQGINSSISRELFFNVPLIAHEVCHYTALRDFKNIKTKFEKYGIVKPWWVEEELKMIREKGFDDVYNDMYMSSKLFQHQCWKIAFEAMRKSKLLGGFQFLQFTDTDLYENSNGMVDCFDDECFISPKQVAEFNGDRVLLADIKEYLVFVGEKIHIPILLSNFAETNDKKAIFEFCLNDNNSNAIAFGKMENINIKKNGLNKICYLNIDLPSNIKPQKLQLKVKLTSDLGIVTENSWDIWAFERNKAINYNSFCSYENDNSIITDDIEKALTELSKGKNVCLVYRQQFTRHIVNQDMKNPKYSLRATWNRFKPVIWDRGNNNGGLCDKQLLEKFGFSTDKFYGLNYSVITEDCDKIILDTFPVKPINIVSGIDKCCRDRFDAYVKCFNKPDLLYDRTLRDFSYLFEVKVGSSKLLICGFNLTHLDENEPSSLAMASFIKRYIQSKEFNPTTNIDFDDLKSYFIECAKEPVKERIMTQFWELDDAPVESYVFWNNSREYVDDGTWGKNLKPKY